MGHLEILGGYRLVPLNSAAKWYEPSEGTKRAQRGTKRCVLR
jgi:hypothetical protein